MIYFTQLHSKLVHGCCTEAVEIIKKHEDITVPCDVFENTPLHVSSEKGFKEIVELLLLEDIEVNVQNKFGETALHLSVMMGHKEITGILLNNNADPTIKNGYGETAFDQHLILR
jgi:ankyrin repeat protein